MTWNFAAVMGIALGLIVLGMRMAQDRPVDPLERYWADLARVNRRYDRRCQKHALRRPISHMEGR